MKKQLLGTTAMVAVGALMAGPASAAGLEASLHGYMEQWFGFVDQDRDDTNGPAAGGFDFNNAGFVSDTEVHFDAIATLDNGLKVQYHVELEGNVSQAGAGRTDQIDESYLRLTANWGQIVFGSENSAMYLMGYGPNQFGVSTLTGDATNWVNAGGQGAGSGRFRTAWASANIEADASCNDDKKLTYFTPRFSGFQFGASYTANCGSQDINGVLTDASIENVISLGANFQRKFDQVSVAISTGWALGEKPSGNTGDDPQAFIAGAKFGYGGFTLGGYYGNQMDAIHAGGPGGPIDLRNWGWAVGGSYETGPWGASVVYLHGEREGVVAVGQNDETDIVELGVKYGLGPGVTLKGSVYWINFDAESGAAGEFDNEGWAVVGGMLVSF